MSFIGRERELRALDKMYKKDNFQMMVLYGRRRIGKTTLLNEFSMGKEALIFSLSGVTKWVTEQKDSRVETVTMDQLYQ